jgi:hypothetical protein
MEGVVGLVHLKLVMVSIFSGYQPPRSHPPALGLSILRVLPLFDPPIIDYSCCEDPIQHLLQQGAQ